MSEEASSIGKAIEIARPQFEKITAKMPERHQLNYEAEQRFAIQHLQTNEYLMKVARDNPASLQAAMCNLAGIGLSLNPAEKYAYLIPRNIKVGKNKYESKIFAEPSYQGLCRLATDSGSIEWCQARLVYSSDSYVPGVPGERPTHVYDPFKEDRGTVTGGYVVAKTASGDYLVNEMPVSRINEIRDRTEIFKKAAKDNKAPFGPWVTDYEEQAKKTIVRNSFKLWPRTNQSAIMAKAVDMSNQNMGFEALVTSPEIRNFTAQQKEHYDSLISQADATGLAAFVESLPATVVTNLYHSFEPGTKGKYQQIVDGLTRKGTENLREYVALIRGFVDNQDDLGIGQLIAELGEDELACVKKWADPETLAIIDDVLDNDL